MCWRKVITIQKNLPKISDSVLKNEVCSEIFYKCKFLGSKNPSKDFFGGELGKNKIAKQSSPTLMSELFFPKSKNIFYKNVSLWFIILFLLYSLIPYKTPWLIINITLPLCFLSAITITALKEKCKNKAKIILILILLISIIYLTFSSVLTSFIYPWQSSNKFAYVHTDKDILNLVKEIKQNSDENSKILIISEKYWPLPFYLRDFKIKYLNSNITSNTNFSNYKKDYDFIILDKVSLKKFSPKNYKTYALWPGVNLYLIKNN
jgi:hypothetical protein